MSKRLKRKPLSRSEIMRAVKSKDTKPELLVRSYLRHEKVHFRTYANLPGRPDIILKKEKVAIRIMGCFWHRHFCKSGNRVPKTNVAYWTSKITRNVERDRENKADLRDLGWRVIDVWECQLKKSGWERKLKTRIHATVIRSRLTAEIRSDIRPLASTVLPKSDYEGR
jgi:DNA mismatch endonuclease (patch repair protein)